MSRWFFRSDNSAINVEHITHIEVIDPRQSEVYFVNGQELAIPKADADKLIEFLDASFGTPAKQLPVRREQ